MISNNCLQFTFSEGTDVAGIYKYFSCILYGFRGGGVKLSTSGLTGLDPVSTSLITAYQPKTLTDRKQLKLKYYCQLNWFWSKKIERKR